MFCAHFACFAGIFIASAALHPVSSKAATGGIEADALRGTYVLSDGREAVIEGRSRTLHLHVDGGPRVALQRLAADTYGSPDGQMRLHFDRLDNGIVRQLRLELPSPGAVQLAGR